MRAAVVLGFGLGLLVAAQVGPISLLCARSAVRRGVLAGVAVGVGAAVVDLAYAALGVAGVGAILSVATIRLTLGLLGAAFLVVLGVRTIRAASGLRLGDNGGEEPERLTRLLATSCAATAANPLTILSWSAVFAAASAADLGSSRSTAVGLLIGVGTGSLCWFVALSVAFSALRLRIGDRTLRAIDLVSGFGIVGFGVAIGARALAGA